MSHEHHHGARLERGQGWNSQNRMFSLEHQHDGNVVLYHGARALWATNTCGRETTHFEFTHEGELRLFHHHNVLWSSGAQGAHRFSIQDDGNLVLYTHDNRPIWASNTHGQYSHSDKTEVNRRLEAREFLRSENGRFTFCVQTDGNLVIYDAAEGGRPIWASNTNGRRVTHLVLQSDGNLVLYDNQQAHWASNTCGRAVDQLIMQNDGNLVIYGPGHQAVWATNTCR